MSYLYMDTSYHLVVGLLDDSLEFLDFTELLETKSSGIIHQVIFEMLQKHKMGPLELKGVIQAAGPGSYTGMRLSHGITQVFQWQGVERYGFYHFDVPLLLGVSEGYWIAKAFKREVFSYYWKGVEGTSSLQPEKEFWASCQAKSVGEDKAAFYTHFPESLDKKIDNINSTHNMIKKRAPYFFKHIIENKIKEGPYYFRTLEKEFKRPKV